MSSNDLTRVTPQRDDTHVTTTRTANHLLITDSGTVHAAADCHVRPYHVLACNGRAIQGAGVEFHHSTITCRACLAGIASGRVLLMDTTTGEAVA